MNARFEIDKLYHNNVLIKQFGSPIKEISEFKEKHVVVVLLHPDFYDTNENVMCVNLYGDVLWQVPKFEYLYDKSPFMNLTKTDGNIRLSNWDSSCVVIEPATGKVLVTPKESREERRTW